ncbi:MAG TPA: hypothetical protein EYG69_02485 [Campylobacterales bacterium]|nr:hypothetical protein [Campylobacterales bacterium]
MLFENFTSLIDGKLLNEPSIASFSNIIFELKKVKTGDLFIGKKTEIKQAIEQGAYGVVSTSLKVKDEEIAWIEVDSLNSVKQKLIRYLIIKSGLNILFLNDIEFQILSLLIDKNTILSLDDNTQSVINSLQNFSHDNIILSCEEKLLNFLDLEPLVVVEKYSITVTKYTTFLTTFTYKDNYYKDIKLPKIFIPNLQKVLNFLDDLNISYTLNRLNFINHFKPIFIDSYFKIKPFGQSRKVLILENDIKLIKQEQEYINKCASWANIALVVPTQLENQFKNIKQIYTYKNFSDIKTIDISNINFIIVLDIELKYESYLIKKSNEIKGTLF